VRVAAAAVPHQQQVAVDFHGTTYAVTILCAADELVVVRVEDRDTLDAWRGEFAAKCECVLWGFGGAVLRGRRQHTHACLSHGTAAAANMPHSRLTDVEDITSKTGSFKKFGVFVRMLASAVLQQSDSVFVDLLTYQDLEQLKAKKAAAAAASASAGAGSAGGAAQGRALPPSVAAKRYLILTYASEFDRVHYPLPLLADEQPDPARLKGVIASLRQQLAAVQAGLGAGGATAVLTQPGRQQQRSSSSRCSQHQVRGCACASVRAHKGVELPVVHFVVAGPLPKNTHSDALARAAPACCCRCCLPQTLPADGDAALLASRLEVAQAELERERTAHRRELRKKGRELAEVGTGVLGADRQRATTHAHSACLTHTHLLARRHPVQLQEELARSRDVARELRLRTRALEAELDGARSSAAAAAAAAVAAAAGPAGRSGYRRPAAADRCARRG
jgi:coiled-coil domain-containing protein 61